MMTLTFKFRNVAKQQDVKMSCNFFKSYINDVFFLHLVYLKFTCRVKEHKTLLMLGGPAVKLCRPCQNLDSKPVHQ